MRALVQNHMPYDIQCESSDCGKRTSVYNIVRLIYDHLGRGGWIECPVCEGRGFIYNWDEGGKGFRQDKSLPGPKRYLKAIIKLDRSLWLTNGAQERNLVFLVSYRKDEPPNYIWPARYWKNASDQWLVGNRGPLLNLREVGKMMDQLVQPESNWGLGLHVPSPRVEGAT